jgi:hypothetical protein
MWAGMMKTKSDHFNQVKMAFSDNQGGHWPFADWTVGRRHDAHIL